MIRAVDHLKASLTSLAYMQARCRRGDSAFTYPGGSADYVLDRGEAFESHTLDAEQRAYVRKLGSHWRLKECFYNGQVLADRHARLTYCEGYAVSDLGIPVHHGWVVLDDKHVIDVTWRTNPFTPKARRVRGAIPEGWAYYGVRFPTPPRGHLSRAFIYGNEGGGRARGLLESYLDSTDALTRYKEPRKSAPEWEEVGKLFERVLRDAKAAASPDVRAALNALYAAQEGES